MPSIVSRASVLLCLVIAAALVLPATASADDAASRQFMREGRDTVRAWTLQQIAAIQAAGGDFVAAQNTVARINDRDGNPGEADVTGVCFCNGVPLYDHPPLPSGWSRSDLRASQVFLADNRASDRIPAAVPQGLPPNYLATDPRHGQLVNFSDECDSYGTRVTSRRYADGYVVIDTPRASKKDR
jgi:hypothetical protein